MNPKTVADLAPAPYNPREISEERLEALGKAMQEFGDLSGIVFNRTSGNLVGGHQRTKHLPPGAEVHIEHTRKRANKQGTVATGYVLIGTERWQYREVRWDKEKEKAANLAANKHGGLWDEALLDEALGHLLGVGFDMDLTGFSPEELLERGFGDEDEKEEAEPVPEPPKDPTSKLGDVYELGPHRLMCGDATNAEHVASLLDDAKPHLMVTDPPYGVEYDPSWRAEVNNDGPDSKRAVGKVQNDDRADWREAWALFPGDVAYVWHAGLHAPVVAESLIACGFQARALIVWAKQRHTFGRGHYHHEHEPCWYMVRSGGKGYWNGGRKQTTLWRIDNNRNNETGHGTQKPLEAMRRPIENNSQKGDSVYDPFGGSGTTLIAAEQTGRVCYMMELDPAYCDVIRERYANLVAE